MDFGIYTPGGGNRNANGQIRVLCTDGMAYEIGLGAGLAPGATEINRSMQNGRGAAFVPVVQECTAHTELGPGLGSRPGYGHRQRHDQRQCHRVFGPHSGYPSQPAGAWRKLTQTLFWSPSPIETDDAPQSSLRKHHFTFSAGCGIRARRILQRFTHADRARPGQRTAVITVRNADSAPLTIQTQLVAWTQETGEESYADTRDILATPPVFTIPPNGEQVVRVALRKEPDATIETAYRVFLQEIPGARTVEGNTLNIALRVGVPLFVSPAQKAVGKLEWIARPQADGKLHVEAMNSGTAHVQVTGFEVSLEGHPERIYVNQMKYVLPGTRATLDS